MVRRLLLAFAVVAAILAPARAQEEKPAGGQESAPPAPPAAPAESDDEFLQRITGEMAKKVEEIRGLKFKSEVKRVWKSRDEAKAEMIAEIDKDTPPEKLAAMGKDMAFFGLVPEGTDLKALYAEFISVGAGGYYMPDTKVFSLVRGFKEDASRPIVFHELVHAVEDQYFDYHERQKRLGDADMSDGAAAIQAIVEGSARYYEDLFVDGEEGLRMKYFQAQMQAEGAQENAAKALALPPVIILSMVFYPYGNGSEFWKAVVPDLQAKGEKDPFARVYGAPPSSTEQILHPAKYTASDLPRTVRLPDLAKTLGEGWKPVSSDTIGELGMGMVLNASLVANDIRAQALAVMKMPTTQFRSQEDAIRFQMTPVLQFRGDAGTAITGWDGDRYGLLEKDGALCLGWVSVWDTATDAQEFADTYGKVVAKKYTAESTAPVSAPCKVGEWTGTRWSGTRGADTAIVLKGDRVVVAERVPADLLEKVVEALAAAEVVQDPKDTVPAAK
jgi:hypothetical protein